PQFGLRTQVICNRNVARRRDVHTAVSYQRRGLQATALRQFELKSPTGNETRDVVARDSRQRREALIVVLAPVGQPLSGLGSTDPGRRDDRKGLPAKKAGDSEHEKRRSTNTTTTPIHTASQRKTRVRSERPSGEPAAVSSVAVECSAD